MPKTRYLCSAVLALLSFASPTVEAYSGTFEELCKQDNEPGCVNGKMIYVLPVLVPGTCSKPPYPRQAVKGKMEGTSRLRLNITEDGTLVSARVDQSSGHQVLDDALIASVQTCKFSGGTRGGFPAKLSVYVEHQWKIEPKLPAER